MSLTLQLLLIIVTVVFFIILVKNVKKGKLRTDYALAWILCSITLIILSIFPQIAFFIARLIGVISTANMVFAAIIFMLITTGLCCGQRLARKMRLSGIWIKWWK